MDKQLYGCRMSPLQSEASFTFCYTAFPCTHKQMPAWMCH